MTAAAGDCESLQRYESRIIHRLGSVGPFEERRMCRALKGWRVELHRHDPKLDVKCSERSWQLFVGFCAAGYTHPDTKVIEIGDLDWHSSRLAHEIVHVVDIDVTGKEGHCRWADASLITALNELALWPDPSRPESDCKKRPGSL